MGQGHTLSSSLYVVKALFSRGSRGSLACVCSCWPLLCPSYALDGLGVLFEDSLSLSRIVGFLGIESYSCLSATGDNGSGGKLNPAVTAGLLITGI